MKILVLSSIQPCKDSGGPPSLLWMCLETLRKTCELVEVRIINENDLAKVKSLGKLSRLGILSKKVKFENNKYDCFLVFPSYLAFNVERKFRANVVVLGPDSPSLLFARFAKNSTNIISKVKNYFLYKWLLLKEREILLDCNNLMVVGQNDRRWLLKNTSKELRNKLTYLPHPVLTEVISSSSIKDESRIHIKPGEKTIILSGALDRKYTGRLIHDSISHLKDICYKYNSKVLVLGKKNYWVYELLLNYKLDRSLIRYVDWIENYCEICDPQKHIHVVPLVSGAGTKNRVLTACALGVSIVTTPIGFENIAYYKPVNFVKVFKTPETLSKHLDFFISKAEKSIEIDTLFAFSEHINSLFEQVLIKTLS
jgi:hypothetical protein